jgi:predicted RNA methylase
MCQESLVQYLYSAVNSQDGQPIVRPLEIQEGLFSGARPKQSVLTVPATESISKDDLEAFIHSGEQAAHYEAARMAGTVSYRPRLPTSIEDNARLLDERLRDITVCDPAIGSGAFPVGMMTEIVRARLTLTPYFNDPKGRTSYQFKRHAIQNSLYGVDIDPSAVEIAKLRLWLSLVVDEDDLTQIKPLPNLDFKIVVGNSLLGYPDKWLVPPTLEDIEKLKKQLFESVDHEAKAILKRQIDEMIKRFLADTVRTGYRMDFDFRLFFSEVFRKDGGFDVVIGNPPYIRIQNIDADEASLLKYLYRSATGKFDIYVLFVEAAFKIITRSGTISFIHPHRFLTADYGRSFKALLDSTTGLRSAILFGVNQVFETATTYTGIFNYSRGNSHIAFKQVRTKAFSAIPFQERRYSPTGEHWLLSTQQAGSSELVVKLKSQARPLSEVFQGIYQGIVTVGDDIFVLRGKRQGSRFVGYSAAVEADIEIEAGLVKPLLKGEHIRRYGYLASDLGIIYPHHLNEVGQTVPYTEVQLKAQFPLAYEYFKPFRKRLIEKKIKYKTNPESWFSLHRAREMSLFEKRKIITPRLQNMPHFTLDEKGWYPDAGGYSLIRKDTSEDDYFRECLPRDWAHVGVGAEGRAGTV